MTDTIAVNRPSDPVLDARERVAATYTDHWNALVDMIEVIHARIEEVNQAIEDHQQQALALDEMRHALEHQLEEITTRRALLTQPISNGDIAAIQVIVAATDLTLDDPVIAEAAASVELDEGTESFEFHCGIDGCNRGFHLASAMKRHQTRTHPDQLPTVTQDQRGYHCTDCTSGFVHLADLRAHTSEHHDRGPTPAEREERIVPAHLRS